MEVREMRNYTIQISTDTKVPCKCGAYEFSICFFAADNSGVIVYRICPECGPRGWSPTYPEFPKRLTTKQADEALKGRSFSEVFTDENYAVKKGFGSC